METDFDVKPPSKKDHWEVYGQWFRLPISVEWIDQNDVARVSFDTGIPLLNAQKQALEEVFKDDRKDEGCYWVNRRKLESIGNITDKEDLESVVIWHPPPAKVTLRATRDPDTEDFLARLVAQGFFK